ncbi:hypothetical protein HDV01_002704 [Terramyces sp. JEL0728]|nr:hypothetical protein HDV01_002704 [Terramyces sp. JEL0728]
MATIARQDTFFTIKLQVVVKDFLNQQTRNLANHGEQTIYCSSPEDFVQKLWDLLQHHLEKEVTFDEHGLNPVMASEGPTIDSIDKFIRFKSSNHMKLPSQITLTTLQNLAAKDAFNTIVCRYSISVCKLKQWTTIQEKFIQHQNVDRASATSNTVVQEIMRKLRQEWSERYTAGSAHWMNWASYIAEQPIHTHEDKIKEPPPSDLIRHFCSVPSNRQLRVEELHSSLRVSSNIVEQTQYLLNQIQDIYRQQQEEHKIRDQEMESAISHFQSAMRQQKEENRIREQEMRNALFIFQSVLDAYDNVIPEMEASRPIEHSSLTNRLRGRITEQLDTDHAL